MTEQNPIQYWITWQPEDAETGMFFLTLYETDSAGEIPPDDLATLMNKAFEIEEINPEQGYEICSILKHSLGGHVEVIY